MKLTKLFVKSIQISLIYFVTPSYLLVNENVKGKTENVLNKLLSQMPTKNVDRLVTPATAKKLPVKASPIQITPQPLLIRRKVQLNPTETTKSQILIKNNKTSTSAKVGDEPKPKQDAVESKERTANVKSATETRNHEKESTFYEETEDIFSKSKHNKEAENPKQLTSPFKKETQEDNNVSKTYIEDGTRSEEPKNRDVVTRIDLKTQKQEETEESDDIVHHLSSEDEIKDDDDIPIDIHEEYKIRSNKLKNDSSSGEISSVAKKKFLKITDIPSNGNSHVQSRIDSARTCIDENPENNIHYQAKTPHLTKVEISVSPNVMEELTNDASDKIFIKKLDFEELLEKYDPTSCAGDKDEPKDNPYSPDTTFIQELYKYPCEDQIDIDSVCENPITNRHFPTLVNKSLRERIWRGWRNSEIYGKSNVDNIYKRRNPKKNKSKINLNDAKGYGRNSNVKFNPTNYGAYTSRADQDFKPNNIDDVKCVDGNVQFDPDNYGRYKLAENQGNVVDENLHANDHSIVEITPVVNTYKSRVDQGNRLPIIEDVPRFSEYNRVKYQPFSYEAYNPRAYYGSRRRNFNDVKSYFNGYGTAKYEPDKYEPYNTIPKRFIRQGTSPAKEGIRYYSANEYSPPPIKNCYLPQSFGSRYAPVSRYQKYLFPCM